MLSPSSTVEIDLFQIYYFLTISSISYAAKQSEVSQKLKLSGVDRIYSLKNSVPHKDNFATWIQMIWLTHYI